MKQATKALRSTIKLNAVQRSIDIEIHRFDNGPDQALPVTCPWTGEAVTDDSIMHLDIPKVWRKYRDTQDPDSYPRMMEKTEQAMREVQA